MALAEENATQQVDLQMAAVFFEQAKAAYEAADMRKFQAARAMVLLNLGLPAERVSNPR